MFKSHSSEVGLRQTTFRRQSTHCVVQELFQRSRITELRTKQKKPHDLLIATQKGFHPLARQIAESKAPTEKVRANFAALKEKATPNFINFKKLKKMALTSVTSVTAPLFI